MRRYTVILTREETAYLVNVPALPNIHTYGDSVDEALANAREAIELYLSVLRDEGEPIPADVEAPMVASVEVAA
jgi:antitoxin HicB